MNKSLVQLIAIIVSVVSLTACVDESILFEDSFVFDGNDWQRDSSVKFIYEVKDTSQKTLLSSYIKNQNDYQYSNLYINYWILLKYIITNIM